MFRAVGSKTVCLLKSRTNVKLAIHNLLLLIGAHHLHLMYLRETTWHSGEAPDFTSPPTWLCTVIGLGIHTCWSHLSAAWFQLGVISSQHGWLCLCALPVFLVGCSVCLNVLTRCLDLLLTILQQLLALYNRIPLTMVNTCLPLYLVPLLVAGLHPYLVSTLLWPFTSAGDLLGLCPALAQLPALAAYCHEYPLPSAGAGLVAYWLIRYTRLPALLLGGAGFWSNVTGVRVAQGAHGVLQIDDVTHMNGTNVCKIFMVRSEGDVQTAVLEARRHGRQLCVRGTSHSMGAHSIVKAGQP